MPGRPALAALVAALALPAAAQAAPPWSAPQQPSPGAASVTDPVLRFGTGAQGVATWSLASGAQRTSAFAPVRAGERPRSRFPVASLLDAPAPYAQDRVLSLRRLRGGRAIGVSFGRPSAGTVGAARTLDAVRTIEDARLAVSPGGHAVAAWIERSGAGTRLLVAFRTAGAPGFATPRVIRGSGRQSGLGVAVGDDGRVVVAYQQDALRSPGGRHVEARVAGTGGAVGPLRRIGTTLGTLQAEAVVAPNGRATVAWETSDGGEEQNEPTQLRAAVVPAGAGTFTAEQLVDRGPQGIEQADGELSLAASPSGEAVLAYTLNGPFVDGDERTAVRAAVQDAAGRFGAPQQLTDDGIAGRVAVRADGTAVVPFVDGATFDAASQLKVALRPAGGAFGPAEVVAEDAAARPPAAAFEPGAAGVPDVLYVTTRPDGLQVVAFSRRAG